MKNRILIIAFCFIAIFTSCQKEMSDESTSLPATNNGNTNNSGNSTNSTVFEAKFDGKLVQYNFVSATLRRSQTENLKRLDIAGTSTDGKQKIVVTIGDTPYSGNDVHAKTYIIDLFNEDDPNTPQDESEGNNDGFITYAENIGNSVWVADTYSENGKMTVTSCDAVKKIISGTFAVRDSSLTGSKTVVNITEGKFSNIPYTVVN